MAHFIPLAIATPIPIFHQWTLDPEMYLTEVIKRLPHNATAEQAAELTPARFAAVLRTEAQAVA